MVDKVLQVGCMLEVVSSVSSSIDARLRLCFYQLFSSKNFIRYIQHRHADYDGRRILPFLYYYRKLRLFCLWWMLITYRTCSLFHYNFISYWTKNLACYG